MSLGKGAAYSTSCKQKLNTKSSTEAETVAIDDAMAQVLWTRNFLTVQGMFIMATTIYQDKKKTVLLAEKRKSSNSRCMRHLDIRYFFITDKIKKGDVKIAFFLMHNMLGISSLIPYWAPCSYIMLYYQH